VSYSNFELANLSDNVFQKDKWDQLQRTVYSEIQATPFKTKSLAVGLQADCLLYGINS
jgi:hypothetical protein